MIRKIIRKIIIARDGESVQDTLQRYKYKFLKFFPHKKYDENELKEYLIRLGIKKGDCIMIHASWRSFVGFNGTPKNVINLILDILGDKGTLLMPANGDNKSLTFDPNTSPNLSGVLSKVFCQMEGVTRSYGAHFSVAGKGLLAKEILSSHQYSKYGFDALSPYGKFSSVPLSKVCFLGLGSKPSKISLFHIVGYLLRDDEYFKGVFVEGPDKKIVDNFGNEIFCKNTLRKGVKNSRRNIVNILSKIPVEYINKSKLGYLDLVLLSSDKSLETAFKCAENGLYMYSKK